MKKDTGIFIAIYVVVLAYLVWYAVFQQVIVSDQLLEYQIFLAQIKAHAWNYDGISVVNSCLLSTYVPAMLQSWTGWNAELLYKIFPNIFYALMFPFVYLIARMYFNRVYSVLTVAFVMANFYFAFYPTVGRVSVGWGVGTMLLYAVLARKVWLAIPSTAILIISYYATTFVIFGLVGLLTLYLLIKYRDKRYLVTPLAVLGVMVIGIGVWYIWISKVPYSYARWFIGNTLDITNTLNVTLQPLANIPVTGVSTANVANTVNAVIATNTVSQSPDFWSLSTRESVVQVAFGKTLLSMKLPQLIEFVLSWLTLGILSLGILYVLLKRKLKEEHEFMAVASYVLILVALVFPVISVYYGISRVYFTLLPIIGVGFTYGVILLSRWIKANAYIVESALVILFGLFVSGIGYRMLGVAK